MIELSFNTCTIYCLLPDREKELGQRGSGEGGEEIFPLQSCLKEMRDGRDEKKFVLISNFSEPASTQAIIL